MRGMFETKNKKKQQQQLINFYHPLSHLVGLFKEL